MSANSTIYTGLWTTWTDSGSGKWVLTLGGIPAALLQAAVPVYVSLVGPMTWIFIKYLWYIGSIKTRKQSSYFGLFRRQRLVLLRNSAGDLKAFLGALCLCWRWHNVPWSEPRGRHSPRSCWKPFWRLLALLVVSFFFFFGWQAIAVIVSFSWLFTVPNGLIRSSACGINSLLSGNMTFLEATEVPYVSYRLMQTINAETYAAQCYDNNTSSACTRYSSLSISFQQYDSVCPFASDEFCLGQSSNSTPLMLSTIPINSHTHLGINASPRDRVTYQKNTTCSPLHSAQFAQIVWANKTAEADLWPPNTKLQRFFYGPVGESNVSWTFEYPDIAPSFGFPYDITGETYNPGPNLEYGWTPNSTWTNRTDADVSILFLTANHVVYNAPVYDPFFATGKSYDQTINGHTSTYWTPGYYVNTMGCIDQHQFCNPTSSSVSACTPFTAYNQLNATISSIGYNPTQMATAQRIISNFDLTGTYGSVNGRRGAALLASQTLDGVLQTKPFANDQWRLEVSHWFSISLAKLQQGIVDFAGGPSDPDFLQYIDHPADAESLKLCNDQLVPLPNGYVNFDFSALLIVMLVGFGVIVITTFFVKLVDLCCCHCARKSRSQDTWIQDGPFQLQKQYLEALQMNPWDDDDKDIPISSAPLPALLPRRGGDPANFQMIPQASAATAVNAQPIPNPNPFPGPNAQPNAANTVNAQPIPNPNLFPGPNTQARPATNLVPNMSTAQIPSTFAHGHATAALPPAPSSQQAHLQASNSVQAPPSNQQPHLQVPILQAIPATNTSPSNLSTSSQGSDAPLLSPPGANTSGATQQHGP